MKESIPFIIAMSITGLIFMSISVNYQWSKKVWRLLNKKIKQQYNVALWILFSAILNICLQLIFEALKMPLNNVVLGISLGIYLAFTPTIDKNL